MQKTDVKLEKQQAMSNFKFSSSICIVTTTKIVISIGLKQTLKRKNSRRLYGRRKKSKPFHVDF